MAYIAWATITRSISEGGLGVRDLEKVKDALLCKNLWAVANDKDALWVDIIKTKYLPCSLLWQSGRNYKCTAFCLSDITKHAK